MLVKLAGKLYREDTLNTDISARDIESRNKQHRKQYYSDNARYLLGDFADKAVYHRRDAEKMQYAENDYLVRHDHRGHECKRHCEEEIRNAALEVVF